MICENEAVKDVQIAYIGGEIPWLGQDLYDRPGHGAQAGWYHTVV